MYQRTEFNLFGNDLLLEMTMQNNHNLTAQFNLQKKLQNNSVQDELGAQPQNKK